MGIEFNKVSHTYKGKAKNQYFQALKEIDLNVGEKDEFIVVVGKTGSGKTTLIHHMNALLFPTSGELKIFGQEIYTKKEKNKKLNNIRKNVGLVFQFPEYQLFEETVIKDIMFGPINFGLSKDEALKKAKDAAKLVGIPDELLERSPFKLSGGQMRKVAIAGILAIEPKVLILDEPTRGLDPSGKQEIMELFNRIHKETHKSIVLITHDMDIVATYAKRVIVMKDGLKVFDGDKTEMFNHKDFDSFHLDYPEIFKTIDYLNKKLNLSIKKDIYTIDELIEKLR